MQGPQLRPRVDAEILGEQGAGPLVRSEGVSLPSLPVEGGHQQRPEPFAGRVATHQTLELGDERGAAAGHQLRLDAFLERRCAELLEPPRLASDHRRVVEAGVRLASPQGEGSSESGNPR